MMINELAMTTDIDDNTNDNSEVTMHYSLLILMIFINSIDSSSIDIEVVNDINDSKQWKPYWWLLLLLKRMTLFCY